MRRDPVRRLSSEWLGRGLGNEDVQVDESRMEDAPVEDARFMSLDDLLAVDSTQVGDEAVVRAAGEIDFSSAGRLEATLVELARRRITNVRVDLSEISFIDSGGLRALVIGYRAISVQGGSLTIIKASEQVRRVLEMAGADSLLAAPPGGDREQIAT